ncbi:MAG TPA: M28 family peptidase [Candidatus Hydrogenedentes bacterium]|nr:M28 family peptidase [Candidatus Hydrogenedentota bacterium]
MERNETARGMADWMVSRITELCQRFPQRPPGSEAERAAQAAMAEDLAARGLKPELEFFPVAQKAFMAAPPVTAGCFALSAILAFWTPCAALVMALVGIAVIVLEVGFYRHVLAPLFVHHTSANLYARIVPTGEPRCRVIFGGHADAAYEWRYHYLFPRHFKKITGLLLVTALWILGFNLLRCLGIPLGFLRWTMLPAALVAGLGMAFTNFRVSAPGAVDNLSGAVLGLALAGYFAEHRPEHTELVVLVTGSEEAGLVGASEFVRRHKPEWSDLPTVYIALESFRDLPWMAIYTRDMNGLVKNDVTLGNLLRRAGERVGLTLPFATVTTGSSDAAAFSRAGVRAVMLAAMDPAPAHYYHTRRDTWTELDADCLARAAEVMLEALDDIDQNGLPS